MVDSVMLIAPSYMVMHYLLLTTEEKFRFIILSLYRVTEPNVGSPPDVSPFTKTQLSSLVQQKVVQNHPVLLSSVIASLDLDDQNKLL